MSTGKTVIRGEGAGLASIHRSGQAPAPDANRGVCGGLQFAELDAGVRLGSAGAGGGRLVRHLHGSIEAEGDLGWLDFRRLVDCYPKEAGEFEGG
jgi:hypothetical protein